MVKKLWLDSWAGRIGYPVEVLGETKTKYRVKVLCEKIPLPKRRLAKCGEVVLVPKYAISN